MLRVALFALMLQGAYGLFEFQLIVNKITASAFCKGQDWNNPTPECFRQVTVEAFLTNLTMLDKQGVPIDEIVFNYQTIIRDLKQKDLAEER